MRLHVVGLPHTQTTAEWAHCAYTAKLRGFCRMMSSLGHHVTLYASEENDAPCDELVTCITKEEQEALIGVPGYGPADNLRAPFDARSPYWQTMNRRAVEAIRERAEPQDFVCLIAGICQRDIVDALPELLCVEFGIGYEGILLRPQGLRVFESYSWMHILYGRYYGAQSQQGFMYDRVIPGYVNAPDFEFNAEPDDYFLYMGRLNEDKGVGIAAAVARKLGRRLVVAGQGPCLPEGADYRGLVGVQERAKLMSHATALFAPSLYLEPFGNVVVEALTCGTPVITTDWGAFTETNRHGVTGYRCRTLADFIEAGRQVEDISREDCRAHAERYFEDTIRFEYQRWFEDLTDLWGEGWYASHDERRLLVR